MQIASDCVYHFNKNSIRASRLFSFCINDQAASACWRSIGIKAFIHRGKMKDRQIYSSYLPCRKLSVVRRKPL